MKNTYILKLSRLFAVIMLILFASTSEAQYCTPQNVAGNCATTDILTLVHIKGTTLNNKVSTCNGTSRWNTYSASGSTTATLYRNSGYNNYQIEVSTSSNSIISMWIDYNQNGKFDSVVEWTQLGTGNSANTVYTYSFTVPTTAKLGTTGLRIRSRLQNNPNDSTYGCKQMGSGVCHDYTVTIDTLAPCSGTPTPGTVTSQSDSICSGTSFTLGIKGGSYGAGQSFQWQSSSDSINWTDMSGDTNQTLTTSITAVTYFRYYTSCNGNSDTSAFKTMYLNPFYMCYCTPTNNTACAATDLISNVAIAGTTLNNLVTSCNSAGSRYNTYPAAQNTTAILYSNSGSNTYDLSVTSTAASIISVWIDYDHNGTYDASEWTQVTTQSTANTAATVQITVPTNALYGYTGMRVRTRTYTSTNGSGDACTTFTNGMTHDYSIYIDSLVSCSGNTTAGYIISTNYKDCPSTPAVLTIQGGNKHGSGQTYQWQSSSDSVNWSDINGATSLSLNITIGTKTYYRYYTSCNGSGADTSAGTLVDVNPAYLCYCYASHPNCSTGDAISNVNIQGTTLNYTPSSLCPNGATTPYFKIAPSKNTTAFLTQGQSYTLSVTTTTNNIISVWIDFDQSGTFDASEWTQVCTTSSANTANTVNISIPSGATSGPTGMRIRSRATGNQNGSGDACLQMFSGQAHDYIVTIGSPYTKDMGINSVTSPGSYPCYSANEPVTVVIQNSGTDTLDMSSNNVSVHVGVSGGSSSSLDTTLTSGKIAPNDTLSVFFTGTVDLSTLNTKYYFTVYTTLSGDSNAFNDSSNFTITTVKPTALDYVETFNTLASIPTSYNANDWTISTTGGVNNTRSLRLNSSGSYSVTGVNSPIVGPLTSKSVFKVSFANPSQFDSQDSLLVYLTFDCGKTFTSIYKFDNNNTSNASYSDLIYDLSSYAGNNVAAVFVNYNNSTNAYTMDFDNVVIADLPTLDLGPDSSSCTAVLLNANPNNKSNYSVLWNTGSTQNKLAATSTGTYYATVTDKNTGLTATDTVNITMLSLGVNLGPDKNVCNGSSIKLDVGNYGSGTKYSWSTGATTQSITVSSAGQYIVNVTAPNGCTGIDTVNIGTSSTSALQGTAIVKGSTFNGTFNNGTSSNPDAVCVGSNVVYELNPPTYGNSGYGTNWTILAMTFATGSGSTPTAGTYQITNPSANNGSLSFTPDNAAADSLYMIMLDIKDSSSGCDTVITRYIKVNGVPSVSLGADQTLCPTKSITLNAGNFSSYAWSDGSTGSSLTTSTPGNIWVKVTDANGCSNYDTMTFSNYNVTPVNLGADKGICPGASTNLDAGTGSSYAWNTGATTQTISVSTAGTYYVDVTDANGCITRDSIVISSLPAPDASFTKAVVNNLKNNIQFTATDVTAGNTYSWDFGDGNTSTSQNPLHIYSADGTYNVKLTVTNSSGCTDTKTVSTVVNTAIVSISDKVNGISVFPNPYNGTTTLNYTLSESANILVELYDMTGRKVNTLANGKQTAGQYHLSVNTLQLAGGTYTLKMSANGEMITIRIVDIK